MNLVEINETILAISESVNTVIRLYPIITLDNGTDEIRLADITDDAGDELKKMLLDYLLNKFNNNPELSFLDLTQADSRKNAAYLYDIVEKPEVLQMLAEILQNSNKPAFSFDDDDISKITGFIILIGDATSRMTLYKRHHHLSTMKANKSFSLFRSVDRFEKVEEDILRLSGHVDFLQIEDDLIVTNLGALESTFGYEEVIRKQAQTNIEHIQGLNLLEDIAPLIEMAQDLKSAKKILKVKLDSPVTQLPVATVINFVKSHKPIMKKFRLSEDGNRLKLDTLVSKKLFLALMNDDLLTSELTQLYYEGVAKDKMDIEE